MRDPIVVIGGGIVGLSTAFALTRLRPDVRVVVLEKEPGLARHQTGRNSGVIHSGIYYTPGSLKARMCRAGREALLAFCSEHRIHHEICGKVIVAVDEDETSRLEGLLLRGRENGVSCRGISREELAEREPHVVARAALRVDDTGIVDYPAVCARLAGLVTEAGSEVRTGTRLLAVRQEKGARILETDRGAVRGRFLVNCAGLYSDRVARLDGVDPGLLIVPFRGHYYELVEPARRYCRHLVYPVPVPAYPFLGVHFTRRTDGRVECGPNAMLAFAREGYGLWDVDASDLSETLRYPGFRRLASGHWRMGVTEFARSASRRRYLAALQRLVPDIRADDLLHAPSGIRAQAVLPDGTLADDFVIRRSRGALHVCNAPSPAATAGLEIGRYIADHVASELD